MSPLPHHLVDVVLVAWSGTGPDGWSQLKHALNRTIGLLLSRQFSDSGESPKDPVAGFARQLMPDLDNLRVLYAGKSPAIVEQEVERAIRNGASEVIVMPLVFALEEEHHDKPSAPWCDWIAYFSPPLYRNMSPGAGFSVNPIY
jgi:hypothetical protein